MIITRSPLRISLGGGGTDLPSYYRKHGGFLISAAIDKYIFVTVTKPFKEGIFLKYSEIERVLEANDIKHNIIRESIKLLSPTKQIEITTLADIPSGTGLGSSGSFTAALIKALMSFNNIPISNEKIAETACRLELEILKEPIGKQDQYISAIGGITAFNFHEDDSVSYQRLNVAQDIIYELEDNLLLFFTGFSRSASGILSDQDQKSKENNKEMMTNLHYVKELGIQSKQYIESGNLDAFGRLMHDHWEHKKKRSSGMSNSFIDDCYYAAIKNGALGGKVVGAGGGGFLMFYANDKIKLRETMSNLGLQEVRFRFDNEGTKRIV